MSNSPTNSTQSKEQTSVAASSRHPFDVALAKVYSARMRMLKLQLRLRQLKGVHQPQAPGLPHPPAPLQTADPNLRLSQPFAAKPPVVS